MVCSKLFRIAGRMQWIAEKDQPREITRTRRRNLRSDSPAHRLAAYRQLITAKPFVTANCFNHGAVAGFQFVIRVRCSAPVLGVEKVESNCVDSPRRSNFQLSL